MNERLGYRNIMVGIGAALHFLVDCLCLCTLYLMSPLVETGYVVGLFIVYNVLAFVTQIITGHLADISCQKHWMLIISLLLLILGVATMAVGVNTLPHPSATAMLPTAILLGLGNSFFHTWGGKQVAMKTHNDIRSLGVFVSTGAFGLSIGFVFHSWPLLYAILLLMCLLAALYMRCDFQGDAQPSPSASTPGAPSKERRWTHWAIGVAIVVLMLLVMMRSWVGESFTQTITKSDVVVLAIGAIAMLGKMSGGWIARGMGIVRSMVVVLTVVLICLLCRDSHLTIALLGLFAVNCTMPVTLYLANVVLKGREGLAFGLLAAALIPGFLIAIL